MKSSGVFLSFSLLSEISRHPVAPWQALVRTTGYKLRPPRAVAYKPGLRRRQDSMLASLQAGLHQCAEIRWEKRPGPLPTILVGGFVPDATEAFYLLRGGLLRHGSVYYVHFPRRGFSTALFLAQLEDLIEDVVQQTGQRPVLAGVSFGAGLVLELLRQAAGRGDLPSLSGLLLISPVACSEDMSDPTLPKPTTLMGRVLQPFLRDTAPMDPAAIEKARTVFLKMFDSGTKNQVALRFLLTRKETEQLREAVLGAILGIDTVGADERVRALRALPPLREPRALFIGPTLILYAEKESSVLQENAPSWREFCHRPNAWFPQGRCLTVTNRADDPVQHASLIFHSRNFAPHFGAFFQAIRRGLRRAA
jgi:pimeloyl-ACP methyl ester carboxylesterase